MKVSEAKDCAIQLRDHVKATNLLLDQAAAMGLQVKVSVVELMRQDVDYAFPEVTVDIFVRPTRLDDVPEV
ncbi:MAG: hypothetical protein GY725_16915 [bacterium]|nr:hypothetical protein [bacterium]